MMGAPGLAFETWDPSRKCRKINLGRSDFETALGTYGLFKPLRELSPEAFSANAP
jgi:hypothetical protein